MSSTPTPAVMWLQAQTPDGEPMPAKLELRLPGDDCLISGSSWLGTHRAVDRSGHPEWLRDVLGARVHVGHVHARSVWLVSRAHFAAALVAVPARFGPTFVIVDQWVTGRWCNRECQRARTGPEMCECACLGTAHGVGAHAASWVHRAGIGAPPTPGGLVRRRWTELPRVAPTLTAAGAAK